MADNSYTPKTYHDLLTTFSGGMDSGVSPVLLNKQTLAMAVNCSVRGGYVTNRPGFSRKTLSFPNDGIQEAVEEGVFQGAGYYRPDYGTESLVAQISGRLFKFTENGAVIDVEEISIAGDLNDPGQAQVWMWQAEKWLIISDGSGKLPIFYDGTTSRRSYGPSQVLGTIDTIVSSGADPDKPPAIGGTVAVTLDAAYAGPYNVPVLMNGAFYEPTETTSGTSNAILTNILATAGAVVTAGMDIIVNPAIVGLVTSVVNWVDLSSGGDPFYRAYIDLTFPYSGSDSIRIGSMVIKRGSVTTQQWDVRFSPNPGGKRLTLYAGWGGTFSLAIFAIPVYYASSTAPASVIGKTTANFTIPGIGATVSIETDTVYSGADGQSVFIDGGNYSIAKVAAPVPGLNLTLINLSDVSTADYSPGTNGDILSVPELPAGRMGAYGMGRNWMSLVDGLSFIAGDIVGGPAGTTANNYRDSVLKTTENDFLAGGGTFRLPGSGEKINSMTFTATLDTSLGQGPLQIGTETGMFSVKAPVDRTDWTTVTDPIVAQSLKDRGPLAQNSTVLANADALFRSTDGIASLVLAQRDFSTWGNTPLSRELSRIISGESRSLLPFGSAIVHDNRLLHTAMPESSGSGTIHAGIYVLNFDPLSNMHGKSPPVYDGVWTGLRVLQLVMGNINGYRRSFAFVRNEDDEKIELFEIGYGDASYFDNVRDPISWFFETPLIFNGEVKPMTELVRLRDGEIYLQDIRGIVKIEAEYRPDFNTGWVPWKSFTVCSTDAAAPKYRMRIGLGEPSASLCEPFNNRPYRVGSFFQVRFKIIGHCKFMGLKVVASSEPQPALASPQCEADCTAAQGATAAGISFDGMAADYLEI